LWLTATRSNQLSYSSMLIANRSLVKLFLARDLNKPSKTLLIHKPFT